MALDSLSFEMNILSYYQLDYQGVNELTGESGALAPKPITMLSKTIIPGHFEDDVKALCDYAGIAELTPRMTIKMTLREALSVIPRKRARIDSYKALIGFLTDEMEVNLIINSQKSKTE